MYTCPARGHWRPRSNHHSDSTLGKKKEEFLAGSVWAEEVRDA